MKTHEGDLVVMSIELSKYEDVDTQVHRLCATWYQQYGTQPTDINAGTEAYARIKEAESSKFPPPGLRPQGKPECITFWSYGASQPIAILEAPAIRTNVVMVSAPITAHA